MGNKANYFDIIWLVTNLYIMRNNDTFILGLVYWPIVFLACLHYMNPSAFNRNSTIEPVSVGPSQSQIKAQQEARGLARLAKLKEIENAESDCRKRSYVIGGKGTPTEETHTFDFVLDGNKATCTEYFGTSDAFGQGDNFMSYGRNSRNQGQRLAQEYTF